MTRKNNRVATLDAETDPFEYGRVPKPFAWGLRYGDVYIDFWGPDCTARLLDFLDAIPEKLTIYAHNGGKFDFFFLLSELGNPIKVINGRIVKAKLGKHTIRDSFAIIPVPLAAYKKDEIDYSTFEAGKREKHKASILHYLRKDCDYLYEMVAAFLEEFGTHLTAASCAMKELESFHEQKRGGPAHDERFRPFYFGGRVEYFESGIVRDDWQVFDVNSMYPHVMRNCDHPRGLDYCRIPRARLDIDGWIEFAPGRFYFAEVEGWNHGALPMRAADGGLTFTEKYGRFLTTSHELRAALELGIFKVSKIHYAWLAMDQQRFDGFIDHFMAKKIDAEERGDKLHRTFYKLVMNSSYGKFGMNPADFEDYHIQIIGRDEKPEGKSWGVKVYDTDFVLWSKPLAMMNYHDVAIAASVTSAARAELMRALYRAERPVYCDTDSIICRNLTGVHLDEKALGAWKTEARGDEMAIAGKKLYALFANGETVKAASKGANLTGPQIRVVAEGGEVTWCSDAPNFSLSHLPQFVKRTIKKRA